MKTAHQKMPVGPLALIVSKHYYGALSKALEDLEIDRYFAVLNYLFDVRSCCQQQICNALAIDKTAMVKVMEYLVQAGFVDRRVNPDDRREHFVRLTAKGRRRTQQVVAAFSALDSAAFDGLSATERDAYYRITERMLKNLREQPANDLFFNYKKTRRARAGAIRK